MHIAFFSKIQRKPLVCFNRLSAVFQSKLDKSQIRMDAGQQAVLPPRLLLVAFEPAARQGRDAAQVHLLQRRRLLPGHRHRIGRLGRVTVCHHFDKF